LLAGAVKVTKRFSRVACTMHAAGTPMGETISVLRIVCGGAPV
jgi:hypothetical protein